MTLLVGWIAFPAVLGVLTLGWGLLVEMLGGRRLAGGLLPGLGLAALVVVSQFPALTSATAQLSLPLAVGGAVAGLALCAAGAGPRPSLRALLPAGWGTVGLGLAAFAVYAAPVVLSGHPAVSGYIRLDDSSTWMALAEHALDHGRHVDGIAPSTHEAAVSSYLASDYPLGSFMPLAIAGRLTGIDLAWAYAPYLAFLAAVLALALDRLLAGLVVVRATRGAIAVTAAAAALLYGYTMWGGVKEIASAALLGVVAALAPAIAARAPSPAAGVRAMVPLGLACAAIIGVLGLPGGVWLVPLLAPVAIAAIAATATRRDTLVRIGALVAVAVVGSVTALGSLTFTNVVVGSSATAGERLGNLVEPLSPWQLLGIWPVGDFRLRPDTVPTVLLLVTLGALAIIGLLRIVRTRSWAVLGYGAGVPLAVGIIALRGWPWIDAKALATASPAPLLLAGVGISSIRLAGRPALAVAGAAVVIFGVVWSDVLAYHETTLTPYDRHHELQRIGERFAGGGPALLTEFDPYAARWFLRKLDAEGAAELRRRQAPLAAGGLLAKGQSADIDAFSLRGLDPYRLLVVRRSPAASRPPSSFGLVWRGRWYEVWQRSPTARTVLAHLPLGDGVTQPAGIARCAAVRSLARTAGSGGVLRAAGPRTPVVASLGASGSVPAGWVTSGTGTFIPRRDGTARTIVDIPSRGDYRVWLGGAFRGGVDVRVDGQAIGDGRHELSYAGQWVPFGSIELGPGRHTIDVHATVGGLRPGSAGDLPSFSIGPLALVSDEVPQGYREIPVADAGRLCGQRLDWVEAVR